MLRVATLSSVLAQMVSVAMAEEIKVGVSPGEHAEIMEDVAKVAAPMGLDIDVVEFSDFVIPNTALADGDIEANSFQHVPYLDNQMKDRGFELVVVGNTITTPMGIYSDKIEDLTTLEDGAKVAIPNDPTNGGRALLLLQDLGLVTLAEGTGLVPSPLDVQDNPKGLKFLELDAALHRAAFFICDETYPRSVFWHSTSASEERSGPAGEAALARLSERTEELRKRFFEAPASRPIDVIHLGAIRAYWRVEM